MVKQREIIVESGMYRWEDDDGRGRGVQGRWKKQTITGEEKEEAKIWIG